MIPHVTPQPILRYRDPQDPAAGAPYPLCVIWNKSFPRLPHPLPRPLRMRPPRRPPQRPLDPPPPPPLPPWLCAPPLPPLWPWLPPNIFAPNQGSRLSG